MWRQTNCMEGKWRCVCLYLQHLELERKTQAHAAGSHNSISQKPTCTHARNTPGPGTNALPSTRWEGPGGISECCLDPEHVGNALSHFLLTH